MKRYKKVDDIYTCMHYSEVKKYCKNCQTTLVLKNNRDIVKKNFCSHHCSSYYTTKERQLLNPQLLESFRKAGLTLKSNKKKGRKGIDHPRWKGGSQLHICKICDSPFLISINRHNKGYGKVCSKKCYEQYHSVEKVKTNCLNCGKKIIDLPKKNRKYCNSSCRAIRLLPKQKFSNTDIELKIKGFLEKEKMQYQFQPLVENIVNADFLVYPNIVIFADGDYWHNLPYAKNRDPIVNKKLMENNYIVLRFKGSDIKNNFEVVKNKILRVCHAE